MGRCRVVRAAWRGLAARRPAGDARRLDGGLRRRPALIPAVVFALNHEEADRSGNWIPRDFAYNLLQSVEPWGILFTNGDNDTFPLWYLQEVEGVRRDVSVVNLALLNTTWYLEQLDERVFTASDPPEQMMAEAAHELGYR